MATTNTKEIIYLPLEDVESELMGVLLGGL